MSIKKKLYALFTISFLVMVLLSFWIDKINREKNKKIIVSKYLNATKELMPYIVDLDTVKIRKKLKELNLNESNKDPKDIIFTKKLTFGHIFILKDKNYYYLKIDYLDERFLFFSISQKNNQKEAMITDILLFIDVILLIVIFIIILKLFKPIETLAQKLNAFSKGELDVKMPNSSELEIKILSDSFNKMAKELKSALKDRENLLRYIGHEIKTPLAKAKFAIENNDIKELKKDIKDIEKFVDEILNMHLITSKNLITTKFKAQTLIVEALNKLPTSEDKVEVSIEDFTIKGDLNYLTIALKNIIDNALKYSTKLPIKIAAKNSSIEVISYGKKLDKPLSYYTKAFTKESKNGHGIGLNLVKLILDRHNFLLKYKYVKNLNIFIIKFTYN